MKTLRVARWSLSIAGAAAWLAACGQAGGSMPQALSNVRAIGVTRTTASSYRVVYRFDRDPNGEQPLGALLAVNGALYGTASGGGLSCHGRHGCGTLFSISPKGAEKLVFSFDRSSGNIPESGLIDVKGTLYGTTENGGQYSKGTAYSITPGGSQTVLHSFVHGTDGSEPIAGLTDVNGTLYGTTHYGGEKRFTGNGTIFSITGTGTFTLLYRFKGGSDGLAPTTRMVNINGTLYGTTVYGGNKSCVNYNYGCGTVYSVTTSGVKKVVYAFAGGSDGAFPQGGLLNVDGTLYGTTNSGGKSGYGTVYSIAPASGKETVLYSFAGGSDGATPLAGLIDVGGTLYGTTARGGGGSCDSFGRAGCGTVFQISTSGAESVLYSFQGGTDGMVPDATLLYVKGTLYGTTIQGGSGRHKPEYCCGTVFALTP